MPPWDVHLELMGRGLVGDVRLANKSLRESSWEVQLGLYGEMKQLWTEKGAESVSWIKGVKTGRNPGMWYLVRMNGPLESDENNKDGVAFALDVSNMTKGFIWLNGHALGRYWNTLAKDIGCDRCDYAGGYSAYGECRTGCGLPTQRALHTPKGWIRQGKNMVVLYEEYGGDASTIYWTRITD